MIIIFVVLGTSVSCCCYRAGTWLGARLGNQQAQKTVVKSPQRGDKGGNEEFTLAFDDSFDSAALASPGPTSAQGDETERNGHGTQEIQTRGKEAV